MKPMFQLFSPTSLYLLAFAALLSCGGPLGPSGEPYLRDSADSESSVATVSLHLAMDNLFEVQTRNLKLRVGIWIVNEDNTLGAKEGADQVFSLSGNADFKIAVMTLGRKEFRMAVEDSDGKMLGSATFRHDVVPGPQNVANPVSIHIPKLNEARNVPFNVHLTVQSNNPNAPVTYADVRATFTGSCATSTCHDSTTKAADIDFTNFPFQSATYNNVQADIVTISLDRMNDSGSPMPPRRVGGKLTQPVIDAVQRWMDGGLQPAPPPGEDPGAQVRGVQVCRLPMSNPPNCTDLSRNGQSLNFAGTVNELPSMGMSDLFAKVLGANGVQIYRRDFLGTSIPAQGGITWDLSFQILPSEVSIPVEVIEDP